MFSTPFSFPQKREPCCDGKSTGLEAREWHSIAIAYSKVSFLFKERDPVKWSKESSSWVKILLLPPKFSEPWSSHFAVPQFPLMENKNQNYLPLRAVLRTSWDQRIKDLELSANLETMCSKPILQRMKQRAKWFQITGVIFGVVRTPRGCLFQMIQFTEEETHDA